jgi:hypothetical protein
MHRTARVAAFAIAGVLATTFLTATPAIARTIRVKPGQSIQAAINEAQPGDKIVVEPGVYKEVLEITTSDIILSGSGASKNGTVLLPPTNQSNDCSNHKPRHNSGVCVATLPGQQTVSNVIVRDMWVQGFPAFGMIAFGTDGVSFQHSVGADNGEYGFAQFGTTNGSFLYNEAFGSGEAGFYIGDSPRTNFMADGNIAHDNSLGLFARNAGHGTMTNNHAYDNCVGMLILAGAPGPARHWVLIGNSVNENTKVCPPNENPPLSGVGILLAGADRTTVKNNIVWSNQPDGDTAFSGGIVLGIGPRGKAPDNNLVDSNIAFDNLEADLVLQGGTGNRFSRNECNTSDPDGLCPKHYHGEYGKA